MKKSGNGEEWKPNEKKIKRKENKKADEENCF